MHTGMFEAQGVRGKVLGGEKVPGRRGGWSWEAEWTEEERLAGQGVRKAWTPFHPRYGPVPDDFLAAKRDLRDTLLAPLVETLAEALAARKAKRVHPDPSIINLVGIGIGEKPTAGKRTGERWIKVWVAEKFPLRKIGHAHRIPAHLAGLPGDIEAVGYPKQLALWHRRRYRPIPAGVSVGLDQNAVPDECAGTLGLIVVDRNDPTRLFALSNNHVWANENRINVGAAVIQPGSLEGGRSQDRVGGLTRFDDAVVIEGVGEAFSQPGDSGAAVVDPQGRVVALLFAGTPQATFATPVRRILNRLKVRVVTPWSGRWDDDIIKGEGGEILAHEAA